MANRYGMASRVQFFSKYWSARAAQHFFQKLKIKNFSETLDAKGKSSYENEIIGANETCCGMSFFVTINSLISVSML